MGRRPRRLPPQAARRTRREAATYELLVMIRKFDEDEGWNCGFLNCARWLTWRIGLAPSAARENSSPHRAGRQGVAENRPLGRGRGRRTARRVEPCNDAHRRERHVRDPRSARARSGRSADEGAKGGERETLRGAAGGPAAGRQGANDPQIGPGPERGPQDADGSQSLWDGLRRAPGHSFPGHRGFDL